MNDWLDAERHVERAHEYYEAGRWDEAETELRSALSLNPYQAEWHFNLGLTLEAAGRFKDAARSFEESFGLQEPDRQVAMAIGINLVRAGDATSGLDWLGKAERLGGEAGPDAANVELLVHKLGALSDLGRHDEAEEVFYLAQQLDSENADLYATMAESLLDRGLHDRAVWCLREAARLDPDRPQLHARLAEAYAATGRLERARQLYIRALRDDPGDIDTLLDLGDLLVRMKRRIEAGEKYRRVLELEPANSDAHASLGDLAADEGDLDEAVAAYDVVLRLNPADATTARRLAGVLLERDAPALPRAGRPGDRDRAAELLEAQAAEALKAPPPAERLGPDAEADENDDLEDLGTLLLDADRFDDAVAVFRRLVERRPAHAMDRHHLAVGLLEGADDEAPRRGRAPGRVSGRASGRAAGRAQGRTPTRAALARREARVDEGIAEAKEALRLDPKLVAAMHNLAVAHLRRGQWARARYWARLAIRTAPDDASLRRLRVSLSLRSVWLVVRTAARALGLVLSPLVGLVARPRRSRYRV